MANRRVPDSPKKATKSVPPAPAATTKPRKRRPGAGIHTVSADERRGMIAYSAYLRAERRGFSPGGEASDWLLAEQEVDALLNAGFTPPQ